LNLFSAVQQKLKGGISVYRLSSIIVALILLTGLSGFSASQAASTDDSSCWLEAEQTVFLSIYDLDSLGNILSYLWEGVLAQGDKKLIKSSNGKIRFYTSPNTASSPGIDRTCINNETMTVP
jgi:hypothetical protein